MYFFFPQDVPVEVRFRYTFTFSRYSFYHTYNDININDDDSQSVCFKYRTRIYLRGDRKRLVIFLIGLYNSRVGMEFVTSRRDLHNGKLRTL